MLKIETHIVTWNREDTIHLTVSYYNQFSKVIVHDNHSTDQTARICRALGSEVRRFGTEKLDELEYLKVKNHVWKGSHADLVIVVDDDEILWHPNLQQELEYIVGSGATLVHPQGFCIYSNEMPQISWTEILTGQKDDKYSKYCCFDPKRIQEINYVPGCHEAKPKGDIREVNKLFLLHYMAVGGPERMIARHRQYAKRLSDFNKKWGCGKEYTFSPESKRAWFQERLESSVHFFEAGLLL